MISHLQFDAEWLLLPTFARKYDQNERKDYSYDEGYRPRAGRFRVHRLACAEGQSSDQSRPVPPHSGLRARAQLPAQRAGRLAAPQPAVAAQAHRRHHPADRPLLLLHHSLRHRGAGEPARLPHHRGAERRALRARGAHLPDVPRAARLRSHCLASQGHHALRALPAADECGHALGVLRQDLHGAEHQPRGGGRLYGGLQRRLAPAADGLPAHRVLRLGHAPRDFQEPLQRLPRRAAEGWHPPGRDAVPGMRQPHRRRDPHARSADA